MATARSALRLLVTQELGGSALTGLTTSGAGAAGGTTIVDASLVGYGNDYFENWWAVVPSLTNPIQQVNDFVSATGTLTVREAFGAPTQVGASVAFELHRMNPNVIHNALNEAMKECYGLGHLFIDRAREESLVVDNLLLNSDFETFAAGVHTNWTVGGAGASVANSATILWHGSGAAALTAGAGAAATYSQAINATPGNVNIYKPGQNTFTFGAFVYATAATIARLQLTDGTDTASSSYHTGEDGWEYLEITLQPGSNIGTVTAQLQVAAGGVGRIDATHCHLEVLSRYALPSTIHHVGVVSVQDGKYLQDPAYIPIDGWEIQEYNNVRSLVLKRSVLPGTRLRLEGRIWLTAFTAADTSETEIDAPRTRLLALKAAEIVMRWAAREAPLGYGQGFRERMLELRADYGEEAKGLSMVPSVRSPMKRW